jgi:hypothetical protein
LAAICRKCPLPKYFAKKTSWGLRFQRIWNTSRFMEELSTTSTVMDALGGNVAIAEITGSKPKAVWNWRGSETFPSNTYVAMIEALRAIGKTAPASLWGMKVVAESPMTATPEPECTA